MQCKASEMTDLSNPTSNKNLPGGRFCQDVDCLIDVGPGNGINRLETV